MVTAQQARRLQALRGVADLLDSAFRIPGTSYRIGLDPIVGLIPGIGDLVSPLFTIALLWHGRALGLPRVVQIRMLINVGLDAALGTLPVVGDVFDFAWKANDKNLQLLEQHALAGRQATAGDWLFVSVMIGAVVAMAILPVVLLVWVIGIVSEMRGW
jgi:hypothetical protein